MKIIQNLQSDSYLVDALLIWHCGAWLFILEKIVSLVERRVAFENARFAGVVF